MKTALRITLWAIFCVLLARAAFAQDAPPATLHVGDAAPALAGGAWLKGEPVKSFAAGKIYVVEFWATWCGPCVAAIPHVSQMQQKYEKDGVIFIGQNVWEDNEQAVAPFVKSKGDKMNYRVRLDAPSGQNGAMARTWLAAAGQNGIPCSFLIDKAGRIAWIGHPMQLEPVLKKVIAGALDTQKEAAEQKIKDQMFGRLSDALQKKQPDEALQAIDDLEKQFPELTDQMVITRFEMLLEKKDYDAAYKLGARIAEKFNDDMNTLNGLAWIIVDTPGLEKRDTELALKAALRANELTENKHPAILDTLARVYFETGQLDKAVETETAALHYETDRMKPELEKTLEKYKKAQADKPSDKQPGTQP